MRICNTESPTHFSPYLGHIIWAVVWTLSVAMSLVWHFWQERQETLEMAGLEARVAYDKDILFHRWNSHFGGVYVPVNELSPPNPYLSNVVERDIATPNGKKLTLVNPTYMMRQVHTLERKTMGVISHLTSRKPIRPENLPDPWEDRALLAFEKGIQEVSEIADIDGKTYMRFMRPFMVVKSCLDCHGSQGYREGEVRGGLSVSVPMEPLQKISHVHNASAIWAHLLLWLASMAAIFFGMCKMRRSETARRAAEEETRVQAITDQLTGLYNRRGFIQLAEHHLRQTRQNILLMFADLDGLKRINDTLGHNEGDKAIAEAAQVLREAFRDSDILARIGGDEFAMLAVNTKELTPEIIARRVKERLDQHNADPQRRYKLGMSLGTIEHDPSQPATLSDLMSHADATMYEQKKARSYRIGETIRR